jgi:uridine kinase
VTSRFPVLDDTADRIAGAVLAQPPTLGSGRLVCVDGPAGSGKTTLAAALRRRLRDRLRSGHSGAAEVRMVHMDDVYEGWAGLASGIATVAESVVGPLRCGRPGTYRRYDWHDGRFAEERLVEPCAVLLVEGVGAGASAYADAITCLVWVEAPSDVRLSRGLARDGADLREHWVAWRAQEEAMFARERTRERADAVVDGLGRLQER